MYISAKSTINPYQPDNNAAQRRPLRQNAGSDAALEPTNEVAAANSVSPDQTLNQGQNQQKLTSSRNEAVRQVQGLGEPAKQLNDKRDTSTKGSLGLQRRTAQITASYHSSMLNDVAEHARARTHVSQHQECGCPRSPAISS